MPTDALDSLSKKALPSAQLLYVTDGEPGIRRTPAVCRRYYIHPKLIEEFEEGIFAKPACTNKKGLLKKEALFLKFLGH